MKNWRNLTPNGRQQEDEDEEKEDKDDANYTCACTWFNLN